MILSITMNPAIDKIYSVHRPEEVIASAGGKGLNVARVARLLGEEVTVSGLLGGGNGTYIHRKVEELGIHSRFSRVNGETRICINVTDTQSGLCTEVLEPGPIVSEEEASDFLKLFEALTKEAHVITISGSLPKGLPADFYKVLIQIAGKHGKPVLLDTSSDALERALDAEPYLIKPNMDEIKRIYPLINEEKLPDAIIELKNRGIRMPIISMGKKGSLAGLSDGIYRISVPKVETINSVGSGDAFIAGCAVGLRRGLSEVEIIKLAAACGTANTQFRQTGYVEPVMVDAFMKRTILEKVKDYD